MSSISCAPLYRSEQCLSPCTLLSLYPSYRVTAHNTRLQTVYDCIVTSLFDSG